MLEHIASAATVSICQVTLAGTFTSRENVCCLLLLHSHDMQNYILLCEIIEPNWHSSYSFYSPRTRPVTLGPSPRMDAMDVPHIDKVTPGYLSQELMLGPST